MPRWLDMLRLRWRSLFRRTRVEYDLDRELRFHLEQEIESNIGAGMNPEEARRTAARALGFEAQIKEQCRDMRGVGVVESVIGDLRLAARSLSRSRGYTYAAVLTLALGIGLNAAMLSLVNAVMLKPLPYPIRTG